MQTTLQVANRKMVKRILRLLSSSGTSNQALLKELELLYMQVMRKFNDRFRHFLSISAGRGFDYYDIQDVT